METFPRRLKHWGRSIDCCKESTTSTYLVSGTSLCISASPTRMGVGRRGNARGPTRGSTYDIVTSCALLDLRLSHLFEEYQFSLFVAQFRLG
jgi:hypothetical protein